MNVDNAVLIEEALRLVRLHQAGNTDELYPECKLCNSLMEREPLSDPTAFCSECAYEALDKISAGMIATLDMS